jgi:hypothetical protein
MQITLYYRSYPVEGAPVAVSLAPFPTYQKHTFAAGGTVHEAEYKELRIHVPDDGASDDATEPETPAEDMPSAAGTDGDGAAPRKRTRRGSRGGRNRKKKTTAAVNGDGAEATEAAEASAATEPDAAESAAVELETNGDTAPPEPAPKEVAVEVADASADSAEEAGYVPMSEWIEDFDRRP